MKVYQVIDSETHFIAAHDEADARACYRSTYDDEVEDDDLSITELSPEKCATLFIHDEDMPGGKATIAEIVAKEGERDAYLVGSTVW